MSIDLSRLPTPLRQAVSAEVAASGERVLYAGTPDWRASLPSLAISFTFGLFWSMISFPMAFFVWAEALGFGPENPKQAMGSGLAIFFSIFLIPFVVIGAAMLATPFWMARRAARSAHVVTDKRILTLATGRNLEIESVKLDAINFIKRRDGKGGRGTLSIGYGVTRDSDGDARPLTQDWSGVPDARRAEMMIRENAKWVR